MTFQEFSSNCNSPVQIELTNSQKDLILDTTNELRSKIANGEQPGFPKAIRMAKAVWNDQLESFAKLNTKKCSNSHDCHNTLEFEFSGQNLGIMSTTANYTTEQVIKERINAWYNENIYAAESDIDKFTRLTGSSGKKIGHFTSLVCERQTQIGCAISTYKSSINNREFNNYLMTCNYASTNMQTYPTYRSGTETGSACKEGTDSEFPGLCKITEPIDPNHFDYYPEH